MPKNHNIITLEEVKVKHSTDKALLVIYEDKEVWLPKSQCEFDSGDNTLQLEENLAIEKELI